MTDTVAFGGIEAGGTKFVCLVGSGPDDVRAETRIPTAGPDETLRRAVRFFQEYRSGRPPLPAIGIASFGPVELRRSEPGYGHITNTPKPGWSNVDIAGRIGRELGVPVGFDTDVGGAALGEGRWGAARGLDTYVYVTVGTGLGAGAVVAGRVARGLGHAEMGHMGVPRQAGDDFAGICPFHGDCLEGMASGLALAVRWGAPAEDLSGATLEAAVDLESSYLAAGLRNIVYTLAPQRIVIGGGVAGLPGLIPAVRRRLVAALAGYPGLAEQAAVGFVVPAALGAMAGPAGALVLAEIAAAGIV